LMIPIRMIPTMVLMVLGIMLWRMLPRILLIRIMLLITSFLRRLLKF
jgi:hypothetical protein